MPRPLLIASSAVGLAACDSSDPIDGAADARCFQVEIASVGTGLGV